MAGTLSVRQTAELLGISERQVHRLALGYVRDGIASVVHGNHGRVPINRTDPRVVARLHELVGEGGKYHDVNVCQLQELLDEHEELPIAGTQRSVAIVAAESAASMAAIPVPPATMWSHIRKESQR